MYEEMKKEEKLNVELPKFKMEFKIKIPETL